MINETAREGPKVLRNGGGMVRGTWLDAAHETKSTGGSDIPPTRSARACTVAWAAKPGAHTHTPAPVCPQHALAPAARRTVRWRTVVHPMHDPAAMCHSRTAGHVGSGGWARLRTGARRLTLRYVLGTAAIMSVSLGCDLHLCFFDTSFFSLTTPASHESQTRARQHGHGLRTRVCKREGERDGARDGRRRRASGHVG